MRELSASSLFFMPFYLVGKGGELMATDIVPELKADIKASFDGYVMKDRQIAQISGRIRDGTAGIKDAHDYAERLGENLSRALVTNLREDNLPNGTLYYNIAQRTIIPSLQTNYDLVNEASEIIQSSLDIKNKIGLGVVRADFPIERINGLIDKMTSGEMLYETAVKWLMEPIVNNSEAFADDFVQANSDFRSKVGLKTTITRTAQGKCCDWCAELEGTYEYGKHPDDIFRRHENCRCVVTYQSEKTSQNVWSKRTWQTSPEELQRRVSQSDGRQQLSVNERLEQIANLERDRIISEYQKETGYTRTTAEIAAEIEKIKQRQRSIGKRR